ncbi:MAG TPA: glycosyltransferase [Povalibacter sp.]|nr:glycosyltransferase [Povalibacter sp.]
MNTLVSICLWLLAIPATFCCLYLLVLTLLSGGTVPPPTSRTRYRRFDVIVPAHNERVVIERVIGSLLRLEWPRDSFRVIVVADNCTDDTADLARSAGVHVFERRHAGLRGKGYALEFAFRHSAREGWADAVVVVDADSEVSTNLLCACAARLDAGAHAVQVHYGVLDANASWRTRLMSIALGAFHRLRSRARERLGLSCGLRGNGWCVTHDLLQRVPYQAFSLAEDVEYGITLGLAGERVHYADEACVNAEMVSDAASAGTQRRRWERGRWQQIRRRIRPLLAGVRQRNRLCLDLVMDLLVPPLSYVALMVGALLVGSATLLALHLATAQWLWLACGCAAILSLYVLRGWQLSDVGARGILDLVRAPFFVAWKLVLMLQPPQSLEWVRTRRRLQ